MLETARALRYLEDEVVRRLNEGQWQEQILEEVDLPPDLKEKPYLAPTYGCPRFVVYGIIRRYAGWYDGNPSDLFPSTRAEVAQDVLAAAGGPLSLLERARSLRDAGGMRDLQRALHLTDYGPVRRRRGGVIRSGGACAEGGVAGGASPGRTLVHRPKHLRQWREIGEAIPGSAGRRTSLRFCCPLRKGNEMNSRERVRTALNHEAPDRVPVDLDSSVVTGISASAYGQLRLALGFEPKPVKVWEPLQMLGEVDPEVKDALGVDVVGLEGLSTAFGFPNVNWRPWRPFHGTEVLVSEHFVTTETARRATPSSIPAATRTPLPAAACPRTASTSTPSCARTQSTGSTWTPRSGCATRSRSTRTPTWSISGARPTTCIETRRSLSWAHVPAAASATSLWCRLPAAEHPRGIRDPQDWYVAHASHPEYIRGIFELQCEIALQNLRALQGGGRRQDRRRVR